MGGGVLVNGLRIVAGVFAVYNLGRRSAVIVVGHCCEGARETSSRACCIRGILWCLFSILVMVTVVVYGGVGQTAPEPGMGLVTWTVGPERMA